MNELFSTEIILRAYEQGYFPMAESEDGEIYWHAPNPRAIIPLDDVKIPKSLRSKLKRGVFDFTINKEFEKVIEQCAKREETWISQEIVNAYTELHFLGYAHSIETWQNGKLVGGLYGVAIGGAFFGESMFNHISDASKAAFYFLIEHLKKKKFLLLDSQYINDFTKKLGAILISRNLYLNILEKAINLPITFE